MSYSDVSSTTMREEEFLYKDDGNSSGTKMDLCFLKPSVSEVPLPTKWCALEGDAVVHSGMVEDYGYNTNVNLQAPAMSDPVTQMQLAAALHPCYANKFHGGAQAVQQPYPYMHGAAPAFEHADAANWPMNLQDWDNAGVKVDGKIQLPKWVNGVMVTTLMVRNLGSRVRQQELMQVWPRREYKYDLMYVPYNWKQGRTSGYAFLNFTSHENAVAFCDRWHGCRFTPPSTKGSNRPVEVLVAARQGIQANAVHWKATLLEIAYPELLPAIFIRGARQDFWQYVNSIPTTNFEVQDPQMDAQEQMRCHMAAPFIGPYGLQSL